MNTTGGTSKTASQTTEVLTQPLPSTGVPTVNYAIALQQYQFQQSLVTQQLLAQQQAVAHAVSIKAAAEQATARAAEISRLLNAERSYVPKEKVESKSKREKTQSKSHSHSPSSSKSSKSKSASPIRHRSSRTEHERYSPGGHRSYRSRRRSNYYYSRGYGGLMDYSRLGYRRDTDRARGRRYSYYRRSRSTSRSRRRSRSRSLRCRHADAHSPRHHHVRSLSSQSDHRASRGAFNRRNMSTSPIDRSGISSSPRKPMTRMTPSPLGKSQSCSTSSLSMKGRRVGYSGSGNEKNNASDMDSRWQEIGTPSREQFMKNDHSNPSSRSKSTSVDHSRKKTQLEPIRKKVFTGNLACANDDHSSSTSSDEGSVRKRNEIIDDESDPVESAPLHFSNNRDHLTFMLCSSSPENTHSDPKSMEWNKTLEHKARSKGVCHKEEKSSFPLDAETDNGMKVKVKMNYGNCSEDVITAERAVNDCSHPIEQGTSSHVVGRFEDSNGYGEHDTYYNLPKANKSRDGKFAEEVDHEQGYDTESSLPTDAFAGADVKQVSEVPIVYQYPQEKPKRRSRSRERGIKGRRLHKRHRREDSKEQDGGGGGGDHTKESRSESRSRERRIKGRRHHKRHRREDSEEEDDGGGGGDHTKESRSERKLKRHRRKCHHRRPKNHKERKKRKRKHREMYSSSLEESSATFDEKYKGEHIDSRKKRTPSRKKRRHSPSSSSSS